MGPRGPVATRRTPGPAQRRGSRARASHEARVSHRACVRPRVRASQRVRASHSGSRRVAGELAMGRRGSAWVGGLALGRGAPLGSGGSRGSGRLRPGQEAQAGQEAQRRPGGSGSSGGSGRSGGSGGSGRSAGGRWTQRNQALLSVGARPARGGDRRLDAAGNQGQAASQARRVAQRPHRPSRQQILAGQSSQRCDRQHHLGRRHDVRHAERMAARRHRVAARRRQAVPAQRSDGRQPGERLGDLPMSKCSPGEADCYQFEAPTYTARDLKRGRVLRGQRGQQPHPGRRPGRRGRAPTMRCAPPGWGGPGGLARSPT